MKKKYNELKEKLRDLTLDIKLGKETNKKKINQLKKEIARLLTKDRQSQGAQ